MPTTWQTVVLTIVTAVLAPAIMLLLTRWQDRKDRAATNVKLDVIHKLVNSNMTAALQGELNSTIRERAALIELSESRKDLGRVPAPETTAAIASADSKITELSTTIDNRLKEAPHAPAP